MGSQSASRERAKTSAKETTTNQYQQYAGQYATGVGDPALQAYQKAMGTYGNITEGYNPNQQALWSQAGQDIYGRFGATGPVTPYLGQGYMQAVEPYLDQALPQEKSAYLQQLKNEFGPAWGTSGKALAAAGESYANWMAQKAREKANIQQAGMQYTAQYGNQPFSWAQQAIDYAGAPGTALSEQQKTQQALALGWSQPTMNLAQMGYQFPQSTTTVGDQLSRGFTKGGQAGLTCCFIMNEAGDLTDAVRVTRDSRYKNDLEVAYGYKKMAKWLVPLMQNSPVVKFLVKWTMTHPIAKVAEVRKVNKHQPALYPIGLFWEAVWRVYGLAGTNQFTFSFVIKRLARAASM